MCNKIYLIIFAYNIKISMYTPREYQKNGIAASVKILKSVKPTREIVVAPTAAGKSLYVAYSALSVDYPLIVLQPNKELLIQNYNKFLELGGEAEIYSASLKSKNLGKITFATINSIKKDVLKVKQLGVRGIILDECHLASQDGSSLKKFIKDANIQNVLGLTATPVYLKAGMNGAELKMMNRVRGSLFKGIAHVTQIKELVENGFWSKLLYTKEELDFRVLKFNSNGSDYTLDSQKKFYEANSLEKKIFSYVDRLKRDGRKSILIFVPSIEEADSLVRILPGSKAIHNKTDDKDRDQYIKDFKNLELQIVVNVNVLSVGFDHPQLDAIITARSTNSIAMYYQQIGRAVRIHPEKKNSRIVDLSGNVNRFGKVEDLNFEYIESWGWGMFSGEELLSNFPMQAKKRPTKESLRRGVERDREKIFSKTKQEPVTKLWFGKFKGKSLEQVHKENNKYLSWILENFDFNNEKMLMLKKSIEDILML